MSAIDTMVIEDSWISITADIDEKYARKLIQDYLKSNTPMSHGWYLWGYHDEGDGKRYLFKATNYVMDAFHQSVEKYVYG